ncbi:MAG: hypothetical protein J6B21_03315 [Oscillospiraceae bacterium]|nr:hypothetical protein [Oscillospiraceae bacterium]
MDNEEIVKRFVEKRTALRKLKKFSFAGMLIFAMTANWFFHRQINGPYQDMYNAIIMVWLFWSLAVTMYVGTVCSVCPLCHHDLKTMDQRVGTRGVHISVGPLPNYCPYCGTDFSKYNKYKM